MKKSLLIQEEILALGDVSSSNIRTHLKIRRFFLRKHRKNTGNFPKTLQVCRTKEILIEKKVLQNTRTVYCYG